MPYPNEVALRIIEQAKAKALGKEHGYLDAMSISVRQPVKNVSVIDRQGGKEEDQGTNLYGQAGPGLGRSHKDPTQDVPAGRGAHVLAMPRPAVKDPKSGLTDQQIKDRQHPKFDDKQHTLENEEEKDASGITYGNQMQIPTPAPKCGMQRMIPSAYSESITDVATHYKLDLNELMLGQKQEMEHTTDPSEALKIACDHLKEMPDYYTRMKVHMDHADINCKSSDLMPMGIGVSKDKSLTQVPAKNIHADVRGELQMKRDEPIYNEAKDEDDDELKEGSWVSAFKAGLHIDSDGQARKWEPEDVDSIAQQYNKATEVNNPERHIAPVVIGHPKDNSPAFGWIEKAKAAGGKLYLKLTEMQPEFIDMLKKGLYKTRSISLYPDLNIRHLGFLGGSPPAVKGLGPFKFAEEELFNTYEFGEDMTDINELKQENNFFKRLFNLFKIDVSKIDHAEFPGEGTSSKLQTSEVPQIKTIDGQYPEGATMAETLQPPKPHELVKEHLTHAAGFLNSAKSHMALPSETAVKGLSGQDITSKAGASENLAMARHHLETAHEMARGDEIKDHAEQPMAPLSKDIDSMTHKEHLQMVSHYLGQAQSVKEPDKIHEALSKAHDHMCHVQEGMEKATVSGNFAEEGVTIPGTKAIPVAEVKDDKDKISELEQELAQLKALITKLQSENEKLVSGMEAEQAENAMGEYREFCKELVSQGRMRPADLDQQVLNIKLRADIDTQETKDFTEGKIVAISGHVDQYKQYLSSLPKVVEFGEFAPTVGAAPKQSPDGVADFCEKKIKDFMEKDKIPYHAALNKLASQDPEKVQEYLQASVG